MSVPVHERGETKQEFLENSKQLEITTMKIVMKPKYVPKQYRICWANRMVEHTMNIFENSRRANNIYPTTQEKLNKRLDYLYEAESDAEATLSQITIAKHIFNIPEHERIEWEKLCAKTKRSIQSRIKGDIKLGIRKEPKKKST